MPPADERVDKWTNHNQPFKMPQIVAVCLEVASEGVQQFGVQNLCGPSPWWLSSVTSQVEV